VEPEEFITAVPASSTGTLRLCENNGFEMPREVHMSIAWVKDVDAALAQARREGKPLLIDFNAAPM
jgi:uncharacterized protein (DUF2126 family)